MAEGNPVNRNDSARQRRRDRHNIADTTEKYSVHAANEPARFSGPAKMNVPGLGVGETNTKQSHDEYEGTDTTDMMHNRLGASSTASSTSHEVVIKVMYHVREDTDWIQYIDYTCTCDLQQYCKWSFICKSVEHFKRCNTELATPGTAAIALGVSLSGQSCPCISIHDGVESEHHAMQVAEQVFQYAVEVYGSAVTVLPVNSDQYNTLKNTFEHADSIYAHLVQDDVYCLVYDTKYDQKLRHLLDQPRPKSRNQVITTCIKMPIIFSKFEAKINMLVRKNHNVELLCEMTPDTAMYKCVITGQDADITGAEATINAFLRSIKTEDARSRIPSVVPERLLDKLQVDVELDDILKTRDIDCVTETQGRKWLVYGYDDAEINRACYIIGKHIICKTISFAGLHNTQFNDSVAEITEQFKHQVAVHLDKTLIYIAGLKSCVDETVNAIKNSAIGAPDKRDLNNSAIGAPDKRDLNKSANGAPDKRDLNKSATGAPDKRDLNKSANGAPDKRDLNKSATDAPDKRDLNKSATGAPDKHDLNKSANGASDKRDLNKSANDAPDKRDLNKSANDAPDKRDLNKSANGASDKRDLNKSAISASDERDNKISADSKTAKRDINKPLDCGTDRSLEGKDANTAIEAANEPARFSGPAKMNVPGLGVGETNTKQSHDEYEGTDTTDMMHNRLGASSTASSTSHEVVIKVMYHVREDTDWIQYIDYTCTCDLQQYCKWSFICKSVEHFKRCNTELATPGTAAIALGVSLSGQSCPCISIHDGVESEHHAMQVAEQVFQYAVEVYGSAVTVLPVNSDQYNTLKNTFEHADSIYAHLVQDDVYCLVYDTKYDQKLRHLLDQPRPKSRNQVITTCIKMPIIFSKFEAKINMLVRKNDNVELLCEMTPDTAMYKCVITGQDADITGAEATINAFLRSIKTEDARSRIPSVVPERLLDKLQVDVELDDILKTRDIDCVTETQGRKWLVYGYDDAEINRACYIIGKHIICKTISFAGLHNTQFNDSVAEITEQFKHQVAVHLDKTLIYIAGLKSCVDETVNAIKNSAIGAPDKRDLNNSAIGAPDKRDLNKSANGAPDKRDLNKSATGAPDKRDLNKSANGAPDKRDLNKSATDAPDKRDLNKSATGAPDKHDLNKSANGASDKRDLNKSANDAPDKRDLNKSANDAPDKRDLNKSANGASDKRDLNKSAISASDERDNKISADSKTAKRDINKPLDCGTDRSLEGKDANTAIEVHDRSCKTFILSKNGQQFVDLIERNYGVNIDIIEYTDDTNTLHPKRPECVRHEHGSDGTSCWEFANTKQLKVCKRDDDQTGAAPVFTWRMKGDTLRFHPVEGTRVTNAGRPPKFVIELPDSHTDLARLRQILEDALQCIYTEVQVLELHTIAVSLDPVGQWTTLEFSECLIKEVVDIIMGLDATHVHHETLLYTTDETKLNKLLNVTATHLETIGKESGSSMVEEGLLDQTKADVIVNTTSANLDLGQGVVSRALLKAAGPQMQKECHRSYPKGVSRGEIAITAGYNLRCRYVIHVALPVYKDAVAMECIQVVKTLMSKCLKWASGKGMRSIAFPAFGTGKLKYPATIVAGEMLNSIERFKRETSIHSVPHAKFVIYPKDKDILEIFKTLESSLRKQRVSKSSLKLQIAGRKNNIHSAVVEIRKQLNLVPEHVDPEAPFTSYIQMGNTDYAALWILFKPDLEGHADMTIKHGTKDGEECMSITGKRSDVDPYVEHITELIRKVNCMKKERLPVQVPIPGTVLYEQQQRQQDVCCVYDQIHQLLTIYAPTRELLANTKTTLQKYLKLDMQVCSSHTTAESSHMSEWGGPAQKDAAKHMANSNSRRTHKSFAMNKEVVNLQIFSTGGLQVVVYEGDILQQPVDCIVNAANEDLTHGAGIAYTIAKAAGQALQEESRSIIKSRGQLAVADVVETSAGNLGYRFVLHAVGPCWHDYKPHDLDNGQRCLNDLEITVLNCFRTAERLGLRSIAVPSVSSGVFAVPRELCAVQYAKAILTFGTLCQSLQEIHFIDIDTRMVQLIQEVFNKMITRARPAPYHLKQFIQTPSNGTAPSLSNDRADPVNNETYIENTVVPSGSKEDDCVICMDEMTNAKSLKCGHKFCKECIESYFKVKPACPTCGAVCGVILGDQPDGSMTVGKIRTALCGYEGFDTITITYRFPPGTQSTDHPCPGTPYDGISRTAYLPDSDAGRLVCVMMMLAFERRLVFTIGTSRTTGQEGVITWNDVHHKTYLEPNRQFGYPDATYLQRVTDELAAKGVEASDIDKKVLKTLATPAYKMKPLIVKS